MARVPGGTGHEDGAQQGRGWKFGKQTGSRGLGCEAVKNLGGEKYPFFAPKRRKRIGHRLAVVGTVFIAFDCVAQVIWGSFLLVCITNGALGAGFGRDRDPKIVGCSGFFFFFCLFLLFLTQPRM